MESSRNPAAKKGVDYGIEAFGDRKAFRNWLAKNHLKLGGVWLHFYKKGSGVKTITRSEALDEALCFGWIDGHAKPFDDQSWIQKFTPRRARSKWSKINTEHVARLIEAGAMAPAGMKAVEAAKADGRWQAAYASPSNAETPKDFLEELNKNRRAKAFFATLNRANVYAIVYRLHSAKKAETRVKRMKMILAMLNKGHAFHPQSTVRRKG
jgi:uncharacterized protein YdeI (YjbR/CyaY-like superfamily)